MPNYPGPYSGAQIDAGIAGGLIAARQYTTMPLSATAGDVVMYVGTTPATYTNGHLYRWSGAALEEMIGGLQVG